MPQELRLPKEFIDKFKFDIDLYFPDFKNFKLEGHAYVLGSYLINRLFGLYDEENDLDIVVVDGNMNNLLKNVNDNNLSYTINKFGGIRIHYHNRSVDIWCSPSLIDSIQYNFEAIWFDLENDILIDFGFSDSVYSGKLEEINIKNRSIKNEIRKQKVFKRFNRIIESI